MLNPQGPVAAQPRRALEVGIRSVPSIGSFLFLPRITITTNSRRSAVVTATTTPAVGRAVPSPSRSSSVGGFYRSVSHTASCYNGYWKSRRATRALRSGQEQSTPEGYSCDLSVYLHAAGVGLRRTVVVLCRVLSLNHHTRPAPCNTRRRRERHVTVFYHVMTCALRPLEPSFSPRVASVWFLLLKLNI